MGQGDNARRGAEDRALMQATEIVGLVLQATGRSVPERVGEILTKGADMTLLDIARVEQECGVRLALEADLLR